MARYQAISVLLACLLVTLLPSSFAQQSTNGTVPKSQPSLNCKVDANCAKVPNSVCILGHCICRFATKFELINGTAETCSSVDCTATAVNATECAAYPNANCDKTSGHCACSAPGFKIDTFDQSCHDFNLVKNNCTADHQCGEHFRCAESSINGTNNCECAFGYKLGPGPGNECIELTCDKDSLCLAETFGAHSACNVTSKQCECSAPFHLDKRTDRCRIPLQHTSCTNQTGNVCGENALCINDACVCPMGLESDEAGFHCRPLRCSADYECHNSMGTNSTMCRLETKTCECYPPTQYKLDPMTQKCVDITLPVCANSKCSENAECLSGSCHCKVGFVPTETGTCERYFCAYYADECGKVFPYSTCSNERAINSSCLCKAQFKLDDNGLECIKETNAYLIYGILAVLGVLLLGPLLFLGITKLIG